MRVADGVYLKESRDSFFKVFLGPRVGGSGGGVHVYYASGFPVHEKRPVRKLVDVRFAVNEQPAAVFGFFRPRLQPEPL